jgi:hypothetical protein
LFRFNSSVAIGNVVDAAAPSAHKQPGSVPSWRKRAGDEVQEHRVSQSRPRRVEYFVVRFTDGWTIISGGRRWGRFDLQADAVDAALRLSAGAARQGVTAEVVVQAMWGELAPVNAA